jgi:tetraacyldisaccharide 4'-kinase
VTARQVLERIWWRRDEPAWAEAALWPLSLLSLGYRAGAAMARARARPARARAPVISVGNVIVGGAGKTPVAIAIAHRLIARGRKPAILSRGYGGTAEGPLHVDEECDAAQVGDEPALMSQRGLRVFVGPERALLAELAVEQGADTLLLDDGFQHHGLARDLDVVVVDASNPLGNARLLPRGPLREGLRALDRVGLLWLTRSDLRRAADPQLDAIVARMNRPPVESEFVPAAGAPALAGRRVFLVAGIARPASFEALVRKLGAQVAGARWFPDHHRFDVDTVYSIQRAAHGAGADLILTTEKDAVRLPDGANFEVLPVDLRITAGAQGLDDALDAALERRA